jgi:hypothetical protein
MPRKVEFRMASKSRLTDFQSARRFFPKSRTFVKMFFEIEGFSKTILYPLRFFFRNRWLLWKYLWFLWKYFSKSKIFQKISCTIAIFSEISDFCENIFRNRRFFRKFPVLPLMIFSEIVDFSKNSLYCPLEFFPKSGIFQKISCTAPYDFFRNRRFDKNFLYCPLRFFPKSKIWQKFPVLPFRIFSEIRDFSQLLLPFLYFFSEIRDFSQLLLHFLLYLFFEISHF